MALLENVMIFVIILAVIIILIATGVLIFNTKKDKDNEKKAKDPSSDACEKNLDTLKNISDLPCCIQGGNPTAFRYIKILDLVVAPVPTYYVDACLGFCADGKTQKDSEGNLSCSVGSSTKFENCIKMTKPVNCSGAAFPVAADGTTFYYAHSATDDECKVTGKCSVSS